MSTTIDQRVVEMRFDNKHFEQNVSTTMSTLDKLKQKLHLDGATKGLENVTTAAKSIKMDGIGTAVESVSAKFSALQVIGVTALANITNSAVNAGKRMIKALTLDPVTTGFKEYETQINATQTILANTKSKGSTIDDVNRALEELNKYADLTIYNFTEMTRNIGTFTAAGIDLETSVNAIQGIANLAAVSGSTSQQASTAMYQLSQALAAGTIRLMDWNSVVNAGMGGEVFQNALKETSKELGTGAEAAIKARGSFRESLKDGWLTSEVLTETLKKFTTSGANEYVAKYIGQSPDVVESALEQGRAAAKAAEATDEEAYAIEHASKALAEKYGKNADEIADTLKFAKTATDAATKVKTFTQLWDVLKESAQSGWSQTWKIIVGDFEEAKSLLTPLADTLTGFINKLSNARNRVLEVALDFSKPWTTMMDKLGNVKKAVENVGKVTKSLEYFQDIVNKVWHGDYKNSDTGRFELLEQAGYDHRVVQDLVNKGYQYKLTMEDIEASHKKFGLTMETTTEEAENTIDAFEKLTDQKLKDAGLTEDEIALYRAMEKEADRLGISVSELADEMSKNDGRSMLIESFKNFGDIFVGIGKAAKQAWVDIFNPPGAEEIAIKLYGVIKSLKDFSENLRLTDKDTGKLTENGEKIKRTFEGIFAAIDIVATVLGGPLKIAFKAFTHILGLFDLNILDVTAVIGDAIVGFRDWIDAALDFSKILDPIVNVIVTVAEAWDSWINKLKDSKNLPKDIAEGIVSGFGAAIKSIREFFKKIPEFFKNGFSGFGESPIMGFVDKIRNGFQIAGQTVVELGKIILDNLNEFLSAHGFEEISADAIDGLINGLTGRASEIWNAALEIGKQVLQAVCDFLGIESPSKEMEAVGGYTIDGFILGIQNGSSKVWETIKGLFGNIVEWIKGLDFGAVVASIIGVFAARTGYKAVSAIEKIASPFEGLGDVFEGVGEVLSGTGKVLRKSARPIKKILNSTAKVVKSFSGVLNGVAFNLKMDGVKTLVESILMLVGAIIVLTFIDPKELWNAVGMVAALALILTGLAFAMDKLGSATASVDFKKGIDIKGLSSGLAGIGIAILLLAASVKMLGSLDPEQAKQGFLGLAGLIAAVGIVIAAFGLLVKDKTAENFDKLGKTMLKLSIALGIMTLVIRLLGGMDQNTLIQGGIAILAFSGIIVGLMAATKLISGSKNVDNIGGTLLKLAAAIGIMAIVANMLGKMDRETLIQGGIAIVAFGGIIVGLMAATKLITGSKHVDTIGDTLLKIGAAIGIMGLVVKMLGGMDPAEIIQGTLAVTAFGGIIVGLMAATKLISGSKNVDKIGTSLLAISGAIAIMALTAFMLSMISWEGFAKGTIMITAFSGIVVGLMAATKLISGSKNVDSIGKTLLSVAGAIGIIAGIAVLISLVPEENLRKGITVVTILAGVMAGLIAATGLAKNCLGNIIALTVAIAAIAGAVYLLSTIPAESAITSAFVLGGLMVILTGVLAAVNIIGATAMNALTGIIALTAMAVPLLAFVGVLALMQNVQNATANALSLGVLAGALTVMLIPLTLVGAFAASALLGVVALTAMAVPLLAFVGILALMSGIQNGIANAMALAQLMTAIGDVLFKISLVAPLAVIGVGALTALVGLMTTLGVVVTAIGALVTHFPQLQTFLDKGIPILEQLASGLGSIIGSFITGFAGEVMTILPQLGLCLSTFMLNVAPFVVGAKIIDESVLTGVGILAGAILALTAAEVITGALSFLQGGSSFADLGTQLSQFMINALPFLMTAAMITPEMLSGVKALAETILILTAADLISGLTSFIGGGSSLETFASQLPLLGRGLSAFATSLGVFTEDQLTTVNCAARAVKTLAQASSEIPNTGGLLGQLVGENDLGTFAAQFPILGTGLRTFLDNIGTFTEDQVATVNCAASAIKALAQASSEIPNAGGLLGQLVGENDLGTFAAQFPILGTGLRGFLDNVGTFTEDQVTTVTCAANAIKALATAANEIPNEGGWVAKLLGDNSLATFGAQLPALGTNLNAFATNLGTFDDTTVATVTCAANAIKSMAQAASGIDGQAEWAKKIFGDNSLATFGGQLASLGTNLSAFASNLGTFTEAQVATVNAAVKAIKALSGLANADLSGAKKHLTDFGKDLPDFAADIGDFCTNMPSSESMSSAVSNLDKLLSAVEDIGNANSGCLATFADNLKKVGKNAVDKFVEAFTSGSVKTDLKDAAKKLGEQVVDGIGDKEKAIKTAAENAAEQAVDGVETQDDDMESAGKDLGAGLVKGIKSKETAAYNAGYKLGQKAVQGEKDGQKSNSPSKLTMLAGEWLGEGLVIGMGNMSRQVYNAGAGLGKTATGTISSAVSRIADLVNTDIDTQPTIRPVLDLSDVRSGIGSIGSMFSGTNLVGVQANVSSIGSMMNSKSQNGANLEVVSAINKLRKDLANVGNTTYSINGITYDDGSNIATAVQTIAHAALRERRV